MDLLDSQCALMCLLRFKALALLNTQRMQFSVTVNSVFRPFLYRDPL